MQDLTLEQQQALALARARARAAQKPPLPTQTTSSPVLSALGHGISDGLSLGFDDRIAAGVKSLAGMVTGDNKGYSQYLKEYDDNRDKLYKTHPWIYTAGSLGGNLASLSKAPLVAGKVLGELGLKEAPKLASYLPNFIKNALTGSALSTIDAIGHHQDDLTTPAVIGGATGGALSLVPNKLGSNLDKAEKQFVKQLDKANIPIDKIAANINSAVQDGHSTYSVADALGNAGQNLLSKMSRKPGELRNQIQDFVEARKANFNDETKEALFNAFKQLPTDSARAAIERLKAVRQQMGAQDYEAAKKASQAVVPANTLKLINQRLAPYNAVTTEAKPEIYSKLLTAKNMLRADKQALPFEYLHDVKKSIDDIINSDPHSSIAQSFTPIKNSLDDELMKASPLYKQARDNYAKNSNTIEAVSKGQDAAKLRAQDTEKIFDSLSPEEQKDHNIGYLDALAKKIDNAQPGSNPVKALLTDNKLPQYNSFLGKEAAEQLIRRLQRQNDIYNTNLRGFINRPAEAPEPKLGSTLSYLAHALHGTSAAGLALLNHLPKSSQYSSELLDLLLAPSKPETISKLQNIKNAADSGISTTPLLRALGLNTTKDR